MKYRKNISQVLVVAACLLFSSSSIAQNAPSILATGLAAFEVKGRKSPFKTNLSFAGYKTSGITRTVGSVFYINNISLRNSIFEIGDVPLLRKEKQRRKDIFYFDLKNNGNKIAAVECKAYMKKNEAFRLFEKQDSSFWGNNNSDILFAVILLHKDTARQWDLVATNLNASKEEDQKGIINNKDDKISFKLTNLVLRETSSTAMPGAFFSTLNMVYAFYYNGITIGAISVKEAGRKFWVTEDLPQDIKDVVAAVAVILTIRQNLYK